MNEVKRKTALIQDQKDGVSNNISRRKVLKQGLGVGSVMAAPSIASAWWRTGTDTAVPDIPSEGPLSIAALDAEVRKMCSFGPRLTASDAHKNYLNYVEQEFIALGMRVKRDPILMDLWEANSWSLHVDDKSIPVDSYLRGNRSADRGGRADSGQPEWEDRGCRHAICAFDNGSFLPATDLFQ